MKLTALWTAAAFALAFTSGAQAETYSDPDANFQLTVPDGWKTEKVNNEIIKLVMGGAASDKDIGICIVATQKHPELTQQTQAEINAQMGPLVDEKFWQFAFSMAPGLDNTKIISTKTDVRKGRNVYSAVLSFTMTDKPSGKTMDATGREIMLVIPGQFYFVTCMTATVSYPVMESSFDTVLNSFEPVTDATVASNTTPGVSALTLYSEAKFGGVSRVVTRDTPDLSVYGWRKPAGSASVSGDAAWEMCTGANYSGSCRVVNGALKSNANDRGSVQSARRLEIRAPADLARVLQSDAARALSEAAQRTH